MTATPVVRVTDTSTRVELEAAITVLRARAQRPSRHDPRRGVIDDETDLLVTQWLEADG